MKLKTISVSILTIFFAVASVAQDKPAANSSAQGNVRKTYSGVAKDDQGNFVYRELHEADFTSAGDITLATTTYVDEQGKKLGTMSSDFTKNLTAPEYTYVDHRSGDKHGIRLVGNDYILFTQDKGKSEKTKVISHKDDGKTLVVGCQGLHYYLQKNLTKVREAKEIPLLFLIPGALDYYKFKLVYVSEDESTVKLKINISNLLLRLFAPSLDLTYDKKNGRLLNYYGISNVKTEKGDMVKVKIAYDYGA